MLLPATAFACLAYDAASNFSFKDSLNLAVVGRVVSVLDVGEQPHARVMVSVDQVVAGTPAAAVEVAMDPEGGCEHPRGDVGDVIVIAAGAPGADNGVFVAWTGGYLSPYNSANWVIAADGTIESGPTLDGRRLDALAELVALLRTMPDSAIATPSQPWPVPLLGWALLIASLILAIRSRADRASSVDSPD